MLQLLGRYNNFPDSIHGEARFTYPFSTKTLQQAIAHVLHRLNKQTIDMQTLTKASPLNCVVNFEFGLADADTFNFLDDEELERLEHTVRQQALPLLDVYCISRLHILEADGKRKSLKFDYNMLRFSFRRKKMELFVYHERGIQRIPLEDLVLFIKNQINTELADKKQKTLTQKHLHTL